MFSGWGLSICIQIVQRSGYWHRYVDHEYSPDCSDSLSLHSRVVVSPRTKLSLTISPPRAPSERLRRKDEQVRQTLAEKQQLVADILQIPRDDFAHIAEMAAESGGEKDARELILNSILSGEFYN